MNFLLLLGFLGAVSAVPPEFLRPMPVPDISAELQLTEVQLNEEQDNDVRVKALEEILEALGDSAENIDDRDASPEELINALNIIQNIVDLREEEELKGKSEHPSRPVVQENILDNVEVLPPKPIEHSVSNEVSADDVEESAADVVADDVVKVQTM